MATNLPSCFSIQFLGHLLKFLANVTLLKYVKSQRSYGFLITKELIFGFQILDLKDHFSASLKHSETFIHPFIKLLAKSKCLTKSSCLVNHCLSWLQYKKLKQNAFYGQSLLYTMISPSLLLVSLSELNTNYRPDASLRSPTILVNSVIA